MTKTEEKRREILKAGEQVFAQGRYDEITMEEIARVAGVGKGTLYRYFAGKEDLLAMVLQNCHEDLVASIREVASGEGDFLSLLRKVCQQIAVSHERRHPMFHALFALHRQRGSKDEGCERGHRNYMEMVEAMTLVFRRGQEAGVVREDIPIESQACFLLNMLNGWIRMREHGKGASDVSLENVIDVYCHGVMK